MNRRLPFRILAVTGAAVALFVAVADATGEDYYVALDGDDSNSGTLASPFRTIQKAVDLSRAGT